LKRRVVHVVWQALKGIRVLIYVYLYN